MSSLVDRLRDVIRPAGSGRGGPSGAHDAGHPHAVRSGGPSGPHDPGNGGLPAPLPAADVLDGEWRETRGQRFLVVDRTYAAEHRHGRAPIAEHLPPPDGVWPRLSLLAGAACGGRMLFVDLETTGLAGGAGTYAFLVGCAWFETAAGAVDNVRSVFRTRQFFLSSFAAERVLLEAVTEAADACGTVVTYNGKSFDLPLLETRFVVNRMETPFAGMPHVDMLHPARRLWRTGAGEDDGSGALHVPGEGCRLTSLEDALCGLRRQGDVPGFEIPARYFHYVRSGDARGLAAVMEHNRLDLLSLALLTARASRLLEAGAAGARSAREALGMGRLYERAALQDEAWAAFARAAEMAGADTLTRAEALRAAALLARRQRRYEDAADAWRHLLELRRCPPHLTREAAEALAVHHEHRLRDPRAARTFALQSMTVQQTSARREALQHRLARLDRKLGSPSHAAPLLAPVSQ